MATESKQESVLAERLSALENEIPSYRAISIVFQTNHDRAGKPERCEPRRITATLF